MRFLVPLLFGVAAARSDAQTSVPFSDSTRRDTATSPVRSTRPRRPEFGRNTRAMLFTTVGVGGAVSLFDSRLLLGAQRLGGDDMRTPSSVGSFIGGPTPIALGVTFYTVGRATGNTFARNTGRELIRSIAISGGITALTKGLVGRARPFAAAGDPDVFSPGRGFANGALASFPSGHTSAAFATATVLARELHAAHVGPRWLTNSLLFGGAAFVGYSRVYDRQHWPSDVVAGAALGAITGYEVVAHAHGDRSQIGRRLFSHVAVGPTGIALQFGGP